MTTSLSVGDVVRVTRLDLEEFGSLGTIAAEDDGMFSVTLDRMHKPIRGWYKPSELAFVRHETNASAVPR